MGRVLAVCVAIGLSLGTAVGQPDVTTYLSPDQVTLGGEVGRRYLLNEQGRLLKVDEDAILGGYRQRPGSHPWIGEHVGKFLHAACLTWQNTHDAALRAKIDRVAKALIACQEDDGYLGTYARDGRWTQRGDTGWDVWSHKYCLLGLLAYHEISGDESALTACRRAGDLLAKTFGTGPGQLSLMERSTHQGMASSSVLEAIVKLWRATKEPRYLDFARYIVNAWEDDPRGPKIVSSLLAGNGVNQTANGKAYEMMSCLVGLVELARALRDTGDTATAEKYVKAASNAWHDIATKRLYITGTVSHGEHFQADDHFPNTGPVGETCATVTMIQLGLQIFRLTGDGAVMDVLERAVYGHLLGAQEPGSGDFCYYTGLEGTKPYGHSINCCLSSGPRGIALIPTFVGSEDADGAARLNLYVPGTVTYPKTGLELKVVTGWPYTGTVQLTVLKAPAAPVVLRLRMPHSTRRVKAGTQVPLPGRDRPDSYLEISHTWRVGEQTALGLGLELKVALGTEANDGKLALTRGPLVLALDQAQLPDGLGPFGALTVAFEDPTKLNVDVQEPKADRPALFYVAGLVRTQTDRTVTLPLVEYAQAGAGHKRFQVWLRRPTLPPLAAATFTREAWSRDGNVEGSLTDGDPNTFRVTFDGTRQAEDWFEVRSDTAHVVRRVVFVQGQLFHDGGWFDASGGKPKIAVQETEGGPWRVVATLDSYPATTATDAKGLALGKQFEVTLPEAVKAVAVRISGQPASGDSAAQAFSSCAELLPLEK